MNAVTRSATETALISTISKQIRQYNEEIFEEKWESENEGNMTPSPYDGHRDTVYASKSKTYITTVSVESIKPFTDNIQTRRRSHTIRPIGATLHHFTRNYDLNITKSDYKEEETFNVCIKESIQTTTDLLMRSCNDLKFVFAELRAVCIKIKDDKLLPYALVFGHNLFKYEHVGTFLKLLGFINDTRRKQCICYKHLRVDSNLIDFAIIILLKHTKMKQSVSNHRKSLSIKESVAFNIETIDMSEDDSSDCFQLNDLILNITQQNGQNEDGMDVLLQTFPLVTTAKLIFNRFSP